MSTIHEAPVTELDAGDLLHAVAGFEVSAADDPLSAGLLTDAPVLGDSTVRLSIGAAALTVPADTVVSYSRPESSPTILISRSRALHSSLLAAVGRPVVRFSPVEGDSAPRITPEAWSEAREVLIDLRLSSETLQAMLGEVGLDPIQTSVTQVAETCERVAVQYSRAKAHLLMPRRTLCLDHGAAQLRDVALGALQANAAAGEGHGD